MPRMTPSQSDLAQILWLGIAFAGFFLLVVWPLLTDVLKVILTAVGISLIVGMGLGGILFSKKSS